MSRAGALFLTLGLASISNTSVLEVTTTRRFHQCHQTVPSAPPDGRSVPPRGSVSTTIQSISTTTRFHEYHQTVPSAPPDGSISTTRRFHQHHHTVDQYHYAVP